MRQVDSRRPAFTLVELLVVIGIITLLIAILIPVLSTARERANRVKCMSNLRQIGQALYVYYGDNKGKYPRTLYRTVAEMGPRFTIRSFRQPETTDPFVNGPVNDITAGYFLLIRYKLVPPAVFICPSTDDRPDNLGGLTADRRSNFEDPTGGTLSYSFICQCLEPPADRLFVLPPKCSNDLAIGADRNDAFGRYLSATPDVPQSILRQMNSKSHGGTGQNVLYAGGHVVWQLTPFCGIRRDNIYTQDAGYAYPPDHKGVGTTAGHKNDTVLTPAYLVDGRVDS